MMSRTRLARSNGSLLVIAVFLLCLSSSGPVSADRGDAAALALPYLTGSQVETRLNVVNRSNFQQLLRVLAIDGDPGSSYEAQSVGCLLLPFETSAIRIASAGAGAAQLSASCSDPASPPDRILAVADLPGAQGAVFIVVEDAATGATVSEEVLVGEATIFDFARGTQASVEAVGIRAGSGSNDGDRHYRFDGLEYQAIGGFTFDDFPGAGPSITSRLVLFSPDATTGSGAPQAQANIILTNELSILYSSFWQWSAFEVIELSDISARFEESLLGTPTGTVDLASVLVARSDGHDEQPSIGNGDQIRRTPFWAWQLVESSFAAADEGAVVTTLAGRLLLPGGQPTVPSVDDAAPVLRFFDDPDADGLESLVDLQPALFSNAFADGGSDGDIADRGDQTLRISDEVAPAGLLIESGLLGGPSDALIDVCGATAQLLVSSGSVATLTCGSVILAVRAGLVTLLFELGGEPARVEVGPGNQITVDPETGVATADPGNLDDLLVETPAGDVSLPPGETLLLGVEIAVRPKRLNLRGVGFPVKVTLFGTPELDVRDVVSGSLAFGPAMAAPYKLKIKDVDKDGHKDLTASFRVRKTGIAPGDTEACLSGQVEVAGVPTAFVGCAAIVTHRWSCGLGAELGFLALLYPLLRRRRADRRKGGL